VWKGINKCRENNLHYHYMQEAFELLSSYFKTPKPIYPASAINHLGSLVEIIYGENIKSIKSADKMLNFMEGNDSDDKKIKDLYAFIVYWLRHAASHSSSQITFEDALFAFFAILKALGIDVRVDWNEPCNMWRFDQDIANTMIDSICKYACIQMCYSFPERDRKLVCNGHQIIEQRKDNSRWIPSGNKNIRFTTVEKARFLSLEHNLKSNRAKNKQVLFRYLFYTLCLREINQDIPPLFKYLIQARFTENGKFCPPFENGHWVGIKLNDDSIDSPLGILKSEMFKAKKSEENKVYFLLTEKYLKNNRY